MEIYSMKQLRNYIKQVRNYIVSKYKNSCLAYNDRNETMYFVELASECLKFFYFKKLQWCGCGDPNAAMTCIRDYFNAIDSEDPRTELKDKFGVEDIYSNNLLLCLAYALDAAGFTEHGTSIGGAWLTEEGKMFQNLLNTHLAISAMNEE